MSSASESSYGARLRRAQDLQAYITGFTGYAPPRPQESITSYTALINSVVAANAAESSTQQNYKSAVDARQAAFTRTPGSVDKLLSPIRGAVEAQYGKSQRKPTQSAPSSGTCAPQSLYVFLPIPLRPPLSAASANPSVHTAP